MAGRLKRMDPEELLARAPRQLAVSSQQAELGYEIADDLIATLEGPDGPVAYAPRPASGAASPPAEGTTMGPVYRRTLGGGVVVPTGRVLVRFAEGEPAEQHRGELEAAGYDIEEVLSYAPHAAWVRARSGDIGESLSNLDRLVAQPGVENVEPQMVGEVARRD